MLRSHLSLLLVFSVCLVSLGCTDGNTDSLSETASEIDASSEVAMSNATETLDNATSDSQSDSAASPGTEELASGDDGVLKIADAAPAISIAKWIQGQPIESFEKDKVYVVEFWATWCGPCLLSMPHMAALQEEYGDAVAFVGVTDEDENTISTFLTRDSRVEGKKWSDVLTYRLALDAEGATNAQYMQAAGRQGIPCAFIVGKSGLVEWIGHPMGMDDALKQIVEGTWDVNEAAEYLKRQDEKQEAMMAYQQKLSIAFGRSDMEGVLRICDEILEKYPEMSNVHSLRLRCLADMDRFEDFNTAAAAVVE